MWYTSHCASIKLRFSCEKCFILVLRDGNLWYFAVEWPIPKRKALVWVGI